MVYKFLVKITVGSSRASAQMPKRTVDLEKFLETGTKLNSPRSLEACMQCGLEPEELLPQELNAFIDPKHVGVEIEEEAAKIRYNRFENQRKKKLDMTRKALRKIMKDLEENGGDMSHFLSIPSPGKKKSAAASSTEADPNSLKEEAVDSTMVEMEEKRLEGIKRRQEKEIESLVEMETRTANMQKQNAMREAHEMKRKAEWEKERKRRKAEAAAHKRNMEIKKAKEEEQEVINRRNVAKRQAARDRKIAEEEARQEVIRQREARQREIERAEKAEEHRKKTAALLKAQEDKADANRVRMLERERVVQEKMEEANKLRQERAIVKREKADKRIDEALAANQAILKKKKDDFDAKQAAAAERAREVHRKQQEEIQAQKERTEKEDKLRAERLKNARKKQADRVKHIVKRREQLDSYYDVVYTARNKEHSLQMVDRNLRLEEKRKNVERIKKVDEYNRMQMLKKIVEEDNKSRGIKTKKQMLLEARKQFALESQLRKNRISEAVEQMRVTNNWGSIDKLLTTSSERSPKHKSSSAAGGTTIANTPRG